MSHRFIDGLHDDLVEAMERHERRGGLEVPRPLRTRTLLRVAMVGAIIIAVVVAARMLTPRARPQPTRPHVVGTLQIGGQPLDAALAGGSLWVADLEDSIVRIDPGERRVVNRLELPEEPRAISADAGSVWMQVGTRDCVNGRLVRIDPISGHIVLRAPIRISQFQNQDLAVTGGGVWLPEAERGCTHAGLDRRDLAGTRTAAVDLERVAALAGTRTSLWVLGHDGTLTQHDARTGRELHRTEVGSVGGMESPDELIADRAGAWVLSSSRAALLRVQDGRVVRQVAVDPSTRRLLASARDGLWIATGDRFGGHNRLVRFDPTSGRETGTVELGIRKPIAAIPTDDQLYVLTAEGNVLFVDT